MFQPKPLFIDLSYPRAMDQLIGERERSKNQLLRPRDVPPQAKQDPLRPWPSRSAAEETSDLPPVTEIRDLLKKGAGRICCQAAARWYVPTRLQRILPPAPPRQRLAVGR